MSLGKWVFVGGMERAGTTSVFDYLMNSNEVISLEEKELSLFNLYDAYGRVQLDARRIERVEKRNNSQVQHAKFVVDATPLYLSDPVAPLLIQELVERPYFIFVIRHPADRLLSDLRWVGAQSRGLDPVAYQQFALRKSMASSGLTRFLDRFDSDKVLILDFEDLSNEPEASAKAIDSFLGIKATGKIIGQANAYQGNRRYPLTYIMSAKLAALRKHSYWLDRLILFLRRYSWLHRWWHARLDAFNGEPAPPIVVHDPESVKTQLQAEIERLVSGGFIAKEKSARWIHKLSVIDVNSSDNA